MRTIELSDDTYERLKRHAEPFDQPADVIERLLNSVEGMEENPNRFTIRGETTHIQLRPTAVPVPRDLVCNKGTVPHGTKLRSIYKGKELLAEVRDGSVVWDGQYIPSLSQAALTAIKSITPSRTTEDGWRFWQYWNEADGEWQDLAVFRAAA